MLAESVAHLLQEYGSNLTVTRPGAATYNPATGILTSAAATTYTVQGVFINYEDRNVDGTVVRAGDRRLLVSTIGTTGTPQIDDAVGGLKIVDVRTIAPSGVPIAWACQVRK
jgi:hypothetical protein